MYKKLRKQWQYHLMLVPGIVLLFIFHYIPLYGLVIAFQKYSPALGFHSPWVGLENFRYIFSQPNFLNTIGNSFFIAVAKLIGGIIVPVTFALLLNEVQNVKFRRIFQTVIYVPHFLSWVVLAGVFMDILAREGIVNQVLNSLGVESISSVAGGFQFELLSVCYRKRKIFQSLGNLTGENSSRNCDKYGVDDHHGISPG